MYRALIIYSLLDFDFEKFTQVAQSWTQLSQFIHESENKFSVSKACGLIKESSQVYQFLTTLLKAMKSISIPTNIASSLTTQTSPTGDNISFKNFKTFEQIQNFNKNSIETPAQGNSTLKKQQKVA
jgi:hypothetical protein